MLETPEERVKLLKMGISAREIEEQYIKYNNFRVVKLDVIPEPAGEEKRESSPISRKAPAKSGVSVGDIVKFEVGSDTEKGKVRFIEKTGDGDILYIDGFSRWAYKVSQDRIISHIAKNKVYSIKGVGIYRGEINVSPPPIHA